MPVRMYLLPLLRDVAFVFVRETAVIFFVFCPCNSSNLCAVFVRATGVCSSSARMLFSLQPFLDLVLYSSEHLSFVLLWFSFFLLISFFFFPSFFYCLACFVVLSYPAR